MGEKEHEPFQFTFNGFLKVDFQGSRVTSDAGLVLVRELDERLGLAKFIAEHLSDSRRGLNMQFGLADLLRQSVYSRLAWYEDLNDAERLAADPAFRLIGSPKMWDRGAALTSTLHWFETELRTPGRREGATHDGCRKNAEQARTVWCHSTPDATVMPRDERGAGNSASARRESCRIRRDSGSNRKCRLTEVLWSAQDPRS